MANHEMFPRNIWCSTTGDPYTTWTVNNWNTINTNSDDWTGMHGWKKDYPSQWQNASPWVAGDECPWIKKTKKNIQPDIDIEKLIKNKEEQNKYQEQLKEQIQKI